MTSADVRLVPSLSPSQHVAQHRYFHIVGGAVWEAAEPAAHDWNVHFVGMMGDVAVWAVDVPHGLDPADGAAIDLFSYHGVARISFVGGVEPPPCCRNLSVRCGARNATCWHFRDSPPQ